MRAQPGSHAAKSPLRDAKDLEASDQHSRDSFMQWLIIVVHDCDDNSMQQAQERGYLSWNPSCLQGVFHLIINPKSSCVQRVLFSRPLFCSVFFLVIILCHYCECLRACVCGCPWLFVRARRVCLYAWYGRAVCQFSFSPIMICPNLPPSLYPLMRARVCVSGDF